MSRQWRTPQQRIQQEAALIYARTVPCDHVLTILKEETRKNIIRIVFSICCFITKYPATMINRISSPPPRKTARFLPAVLLMLFLQARLVETAPWYFLPTFGHDVRWVQGIADYPSSTTETSPPLPVQARFLRSADSGFTEREREFVHWRKATFPHEDFMRIMPERNVFGWYAHAFNVPKWLMKLDIVMDLGIVDDADETFVNGTFVGSTGRVPNGSVWQKDRRYRIPADLLRENGNAVAVQTWSLWGLGGIVGPPVLKTAAVPADASTQVTRPGVFLIASVGLWKYPQAWETQAMQRSGRHAANRLLAWLPAE